MNRKEKAFATLCDAMPGAPLAVLALFDAACERPRLSPLNYPTMRDYQREAERQTRRLEQIRALAMTIRADEIEPEDVPDLQAIERAHIEWHRAVERLTPYCRRDAVLEAMRTIKTRIERRQRSKTRAA